MRWIIPLSLISEKYFQIKRKQAQLTANRRKNWRNRQEGLKGRDVAAWGRAKRRPRFKVARSQALKEATSQTVSHIIRR